jgi:hypothetical protein
MGQTPGTASTYSIPRESDLYACFVDSCYDNIIDLFARINRKSIERCFDEYSEYNGSVAAESLVSQT